MQSKIDVIATKKSGEIYKKCVDLVKYESPHKFIDSLYQKYKDLHKNNPNINGRIFELAICETLAHEGIMPFYYQANFERVPNADFDIVLYDAKRPVVLTMKVSLRERYKQADLEGLALRNVYRQAESYLITLEATEAPGVVSKIESGDVAGLDKCILANTEQYSELLKKLSGYRFSQAEKIMPINGVCFRG